MIKTAIPNLPGFRIVRAELIIPTFFISCLSLALPLLTLQVYDRILPNPESGTLGVLIAGISVAIVLELVLRLCRSYRLGWVAASYEHKMACQAINHVLNADLSVLTRNGSGENLNRMAAIGKLREFYNGYDLVTYTELSFVALYLGLIAYIAGALVLVPVTILVLFIIASIFMGKWLNRALSDRDVADDRRYDFLIESLQGIHTIKAFALEKQFQRRYERLQYDTTLANYDVTEATANTFNAATIYAHIMLACVITFGAWSVLQGQMSSGALIASILLSGRVMQPVQRALGLWTRYQDFCVARQKLGSLFSILVLENDHKTIDQSDRQGRLQLRHLSAAPLFRNVDLAVRVGECVQITGGHGAGKTTLLKMIAGLYASDAGEIFIDGVAPSDYAPQELLNHLAYIPTQGVIFRGTIRDNLTRFGTIPQDQVQSITAMLGIENDVSRLPRGFDTWMEGTEQDTVPPGLRQRIAIARTLTARPRIILFDNADRNLDREGYRQIHALLGRLKEKVALVMVTEDQNLSRLATRRLVLTPGGLHEVTIDSEVESIFRELRA